MDSARPVIFDFKTIPDYVSAMLAWHRSVSTSFSIRTAAQREGISHTHVSRLASGKRRLNRDLIEPLARILKLTGEERAQLDRWAKLDRLTHRRGVMAKGGAIEAGGKHRSSSVNPRRAQNHLLSNWLNVYVRDAARIKGFEPNAERLHRILGAIASPSGIERSLSFLLREGFLRRTLDGRVVPNEGLVISTDGLPNAKIRAFHKQALTIARRNIDILPTGRRHEAAVVLRLGPDGTSELRDLLREFYERLLQFAEEHNKEDDGLYQVLINFTPITMGPGELDATE